MRILKTTLAAATGSLAAFVSPAISNQAQITLGNGENNAIKIDGITRQDGHPVFSDIHVTGEAVVTRRANATMLVFPEVIIEENGWLVLHPVAGGKPDGEVVAGYAYVPKGVTKNVSIMVDHRVLAGDAYLVMLHSDVDQDKVFDFVFVDGTNVEDKAVFEGARMIAHIFEAP